MASSASAPTLLHSLQPRPPTPPRELRTHDIKNEPSRRPSPLNPRHSLHTPPNVNSPASGADNTHTNPSSTRTGKRVGWSGQNQYYKDPSDSHVNGKPYKSSPLSSAARPYKSSPLSSEVRPIKGILKPSASPVTLNQSFPVELDGQTNPINIVEMLDSTIKQLAGADRDSKRDAYMTLSRALKASNNLPDRVALQNKMSLFTQFIQRDLTAKDENNTLDSSLVNHALTLLATFLQFQAIASTVPLDFAVFIIDYCIRSFEDASQSKDVIRHLLQVVALQTFPAKIMTQERVGRLVSSLHRIEDHYPGKGIVMKRLHIYKRLVSQARGHMVVHTEWLKDVLTDMLSTIGDIQNQAISLGLDAGFSLRPGTQMLRKAMEIFQARDDETTYIEFYISRLQELSRDKQKSIAVPKIWSVVILFLRCPLEKWEFYGPWMKLIQDSFNSSDIPTKLEANYAWNRYSYLSINDNGVSQKVLLSLCQPLLSQLRRKPNAKHPEDGVKLRKTVIGGVCSLYYYAFRPGNDKKPARPELIWDHAVYPVFERLLGLVGPAETHRSDDVLQASRILTSLLNVSTPVVWRADRIMDLPPVKPDELPSLDPKWIRQNSSRIFQAVGPILEKKFTDLINKESLVHRLWTSLIGSIAAASAKDIKVSEDTIAFLARMLGLLCKIWNKGCPGDQASQVSDFYASTQLFVSTTVQALGVLPFMEKKLSMTVSHTFEPVATPSTHASRADKNRGVIRSPLHHLFSMLSSVPPGGADNDEFVGFFEATFEPFLTTKNGRKTLELTKELLRLIPDNTLCPYATWVVGANAMKASLSASVSSVTPHNDKPFGPEFREIASFLERGITLHPNLPHSQWLSLLEPLADRVTREVGDAGHLLVITEPLAKVLLDFLESSSPFTPTKVEMICSVIASAKLPRDIQALAAAKRRLWGPIPGQKISSADPFEHLPKLMNLALQRCYDSPELCVATQTGHLLSSVCNFLQMVGSANTLTQLAKLEKGLLLWLEDEKGLLESPVIDIVSQNIHRVRVQSIYLPWSQLRQLWSLVCSEIISLGRLGKQQFNQLEGLLSAAFRSKHTSVVNKAAETWNALAQDDEDLECSDDLKSVVSSLRSVVDLIVPSLEGADGDFGAQTTYIESQEVVILSTGSSHEAKQQELPLELPPNKQSAKSSRASTPRLRHDNSQIQFEPIPDSPPTRVEESQHFTDRQKEVRERQKESAMAYSDMQEVAASTSQEEVQTGYQGAPVEYTPEKDTSYQEISTPTPRRGQYIPMDVDNDPPSSPLEPRPYPLLSEIRSRSRASSSIEDWDLSSPPLSPVTSRQQVAHEADPPHITMTDESTQAKAATPPKPKSQNTAKQVAAPKRKAPTTPVHGRNLRSRASESPKSGEDEFVDAKTEIERSSPVPDKDTSFALSEGDESNMMKFIVELESRNVNSALDEYRSPPVPKVIEECITVRAESDDDGEREDDIAESLPKVVPSTPIDASADSSGSGKKRKKRRESHGGRRKRRKSTQPTTQYVSATETPSGVRTRSARKEQERKRISEQSPKKDHDTDEELMSQIIGESFAASQSQQGDTQESEPASIVQDSANTSRVLENKADFLLGFLKDGVETLQDASLSRREVNKIEDALMDLKRALYAAEERGRKRAS